MSGDDILKKVLKDHGEHLSKLLNAVANEHRVLVASMLIDGTADFSKLQDATGLSKTALSHHLGILTESGMITNPSRGRYELSEDGRTLLSSIGDTYMGTVWRKEEESKRRAELFRNAYRRRKTGLEVKIVDLKTMSVASFRAISESPEHDAASKLASWAQGKGYLDDLDTHPIFGFNNPSPTRGKKEYGYEFWIKVHDDFEEKGTVIKEITGGRYAVTLSESLSIIGERWMQLVQWVKDNGYEFGDAQCLEKTHDFSAPDEELALDLYQAIK